MAVYLTDASIRKNLFVTFSTFWLWCCFPANAADVAIDDDAGAAEFVPEAWYPRTITSEKGTAIIHAPQIDAWTDFETITAWVAFRITATGSENSYYGSIRFDAETDTDLREREVLLHDIVVNELTIDGLADDAEEYLLVREAFTSQSRTVPLDLVLEYLPRDVAMPSVEGLNREPPRIFASTKPALLLRVDTEPLFVPVGDGDLKFVINSNWDVLRVGDEGSLYFCYDDAWLTSGKMSGPWAWAETLPDRFAGIPDDANWSNVQQCLPEDLSSTAVPERAEPTVFYSATPAELLSLDGDPKWEAIYDSGLSYAANTKQELFRLGESLYFLISGRWFQASELTGPWTLAATLPDAFQAIPAEDAENSHPKSYIRKSVPGTQESWEAALVASIPRKAAIVRGTESALDLEVTYAGEPTFVTIETTDIEMAVNTSFQVLRYEGVYYLCRNAVWLTGFTANGPWQFADSIPTAFATIPPSSPAYNTTFVKIDDSDEESIEYEYTAGYEHAYVSNSTVVYGTGYPSPAVTFTIAYGIYDGWWGYPYYPYYPWPPTYGYGSWYDPGTGRYGETIVGYGPYGAAGGTAVFNPETGAYARGQAVWDSDEFAGRSFAYNPNTDTSIARNRYIDFEDNEGWSQRVAQRGDEWRYTESQWEDGRMVTEFESSRGTEGEINRQRQGDSVVSEGTITRGDQEATFDSVRERQGDTIVSEGSITGEDRSATFESVIDDGTYSGNIQGSEGGTGNIDRQLEDGEITGGSTLTRDGKTIETDVTRTAEGVQREFETSGGGQGVSQRSGDSNQFLYQSGSGDVYAGRDGKVYQKTDDGWSQMQNPAGQARNGSSGANVEQLPAGGFASAQSARQTPATTYESRTRASTYGSGGYNLDRDYQSRQSGFDRYSRHRSSAGSSGRSRMPARGRRR